MEPPSDEENYRSAPMTRFPMGTSQELIYFPLNGAAVLLPTQEVNVLASCAEFGTITAHAARIGQQFSESTLSSPERLARLASQGALVSQGEAFRAARGAVTEERAEVGWLTIPTCDRPDKLRRAVESYVRSAERFGRRFRLFVADDSRAEATRKTNKEVLRGAAAGSAIEIHYAGYEEKVRYAEALTEEGDLPPAVVRFALFGHGDGAPTMGANRNAILLQTQGSMALSVDDDTVCKVGRAPDLPEREVLKLGGEGDPLEFWSFPDRESAVRFVRWQDVDIVSQHERLLGRSLPSAIRDWGQARLSLVEACTHLLLGLCKPVGRIRLTYNGIVGDSAMHSSLLLSMITNAETRERLTASEEIYRSARSSREMLRQTPNYLISHVEPCVSTCLGMDNREPLPPFFPICRNEDGLFGYTVERCLSGSYAGHVPWAVLHSPDDARTYSSEASSAVRVSDIILACIRSWPGWTRARPVSACLPSLGRHLAELADLGREEFREIIRILLYQAASHRVAYQESLLRRYAASPAHWADDTRRGIDSTRRAACDPKYLVPSDLPASGSLELALVQEMVGKFGRLLDYWPAVMQQAATFSGAGRHVGGIVH